jgi:eukaryotic-like serine/threonine-protein kinase
MSVAGAEPSWSDIQPYLDHALELELAQREAWLEDLGRTQPRMAQAVRIALQGCEALSSGGFLDFPVLTSAEIRSLLERHHRSVSQDVSATTVDTWHEWVAGNTVGPYRLIHSIGNGGMSSVWLAERHDGQLKRHVALKLPVVGTRLRFEHFVRERDALASLTHPQIARLYDAGVSASGQPYLAMEYVEGTALLRTCEERRLNVRERLQIFLQVLEATQFAHSALIIHRDLKPSNILVTPQNRVVLLDFGISKLMSEPNAQATVLGRAMTPDYASPEQISGRPLGTASDIYSLGVILYELLTGLRPYRLRRASPAALEEAILSSDLLSPSARLKIEPTGTPAAGRILARTLAGDIDTIVLKALKKSPEERYASVSAFAQDIRNYMEGLPVSARPDSFAYRAGRFISRHKVPVLAACLATVVLVSGSVLFYRQARLAAEDSARAIRLADRNAAVTEFLARLLKEAPESPQPLMLSEILARAEALAMHDTGDPPENRAAILEMIAARQWKLSNNEHAIRLMTEAVALLRDSSDRSLRSLYTCRLASIRADRKHAQQEIQTIMREVEASSADPETAAECLLSRAAIDGELGRAQDMLRHTQQGLHLISRSRVPAPLLEAKLLSLYASATRRAGRSFEAQQHFEQTMRKFKAIGRERSEDALKTLNDWASMITQIAPLEAVGLLERAEYIERSREPGAAVDPALPINRALALHFAGRLGAAEAIFKTQCRSGPEDVTLCVQGLAAIMLDLQQPERAADYLAQAEKLLSQQAETHDARQHLLQGRFDLLHGRVAEASRQVEFALGLAATSAEIWRRKSEIELAMQRADAAVVSAREAVQISQTQQQGFPHSRQTGLSSLALGNALEALGKHVEARTAFVSAIENLANTVDADHPQLLEAQQRLNAPMPSSSAETAIGLLATSLTHGKERGIRP